MNPRLAVTLVIGFVALLVFIYAMSARRGRRQNELLSSQRERILDYQVLLDEIHSVAKQAIDVDPSAALIDMTITKFKQREIR